MVLQMSEEWARKWHCMCLFTTTKFVEFVTERSPFGEKTLAQFSLP